MNKTLFKTFISFFILFLSASCSIELQRYYHEYEIKTRALGYKVNSTWESESSTLFEVRTDSVPSMFLCNFRISEDYYETITLDIFNTPSKSLSKTMYSSILWTEMDNLVYDVTLERMLGQYGGKDKAIFINDVRKKIMNNLEAYNN